MKLRSFLPIAILAAASVATANHHNEGESMMNDMSDSVKRGAASMKEKIKNSDLSKATVKKAQRMLNERGYDVSVDGFVGNETKKAVMKFQEDKKLEISGMLNMPTLEALGVEMGEMMGMSRDENPTRRPSSTETEVEKPKTNNILAPSEMDEKDRRHY